MDSLALAISGGWAAGISAYATVLVLGLSGRADIVDTPDVLQRTDVLVVISAFAALEFVIDKIRYIDSIWDTVHTIVRPIVAGVVGWLVAGGTSTAEHVLIAVLAGTVALLSHAAKAGVRLAINSSPEPASNVAVSMAENALLVGVLLLATQYAGLGAGVAIVMLAAASGLAIALFGRIKQGWRTLHQKHFVGPSR